MFSKIVALVLLLTVLQVSPAYTEPSPQGQITIRRMPPGVAPEEIRKEWIGVTMSYVREDVCNIEIVYEVPMRPIRGYVVYQHVALEALRKKSPAAYAWWIANDFPKPGMFFCFYEELLM